MSQVDCKTVGTATTNQAGLDGSARHTVLGWLTRVVDTALTWQERATQRHHLAGLPDYLLKDMGLSRADVSHETRKPFWAA